MKADVRLRFLPGSGKDVLSSDADLETLLCRLDQGETEVRLWSAETWPDDLPACLSAEELQRAHAFRRSADRRAFVAGRLLMRRVLAHCLNLPNPADVSIETDEKGKPFCPLRAAPFFNLSHCPDCLGLAIRRRGRVGLDLEDTRREIRYPALAHRFFSEAEAARVEAEGASAFFRIWTRKEALVKCMGVGLTVSLRELDTFSLESTGDWCFREFSPESWLQGCVVTGGGQLCQEGPE